MKNSIKKFIFLILIGLNINSSFFEKTKNNYKAFNNYFLESKDEFLKTFKPIFFPICFGFGSIGLYEIIKYIKNTINIKRFGNERIEKLERINEILKNYPNEKQLYEIAIHEIGHLVCLLFGKDNAYKLEYITIIPEKENLGLVSSYFKNDLSLINCEQIKSNVTHLLGGYAAEILYLNTIKDGCFEDLNLAKNEIKNMILVYGMNGLDLINYNENDDKYKQAASQIFYECLQEAGNIINENKGLIEVLLKELLEKKILYKEDIKTICLNYGINKFIVENF